MSTPWIVFSTIVALVAVGLIILGIYLAVSGSEYVEKDSTSESRGVPKITESVTAAPVITRAAESAEAVAVTDSPTLAPRVDGAARSLESELLDFIEAGDYDNYQIDDSAAQVTKTRQVGFLGMSVGEGQFVRPIGEFSLSVETMIEWPAQYPLPTLPVEDFITLPGWSTVTLSGEFESPPFNPDSLSRAFWSSEWRALVALLVLLRRIRGARPSRADMQLAATLIRLLMLNHRRFVLIYVRRRRTSDDAIARQLFALLRNYLREVIRLALLPESLFGTGRQRLHGVIFEFSGTFREYGGWEDFRETFVIFSDRAFMDAGFTIGMFARGVGALNSKSVGKLESALAALLRGKEETPSIDAMLETDEEFERALASRRVDGAQTSSDSSEKPEFATPMITPAPRSIGEKESQESENVKFATPIVNA